MFCARSIVYHMCTVGWSSLLLLSIVWSMWRRHEMERKQHKNVVPCKHGRSDYHHHFYGVSLLFTCTYNIRQLNQVYKTYSFRGGVQGKKTLIPYTFNILDHFFLSFSLQFIHFKNVDVNTFWEGRDVWESVYFVCSFKCWQLWMATK